MDLEDQKLSRDQLLALKDYHGKAADDALGRIILAILAGAGSGLIFVANSPIVTTGSLAARLLGVAASAALLMGVVCAFFALLSSRELHLTARLGYGLRVQKADFDDDFAPHLDLPTVEALRQSQSTQSINFDALLRKAQDQPQRMVRRATFATALGIATIVGVYWYAPPQKLGSQTPTAAMEKAATPKDDGPHSGG